MRREFLSELKESRYETKEALLTNRREAKESIKALKDDIKPLLVLRYKFVGGLLALSIIVSIITTTGTLYHNQQSLKRELEARAKLNYPKEMALYYKGVKE